MPSGVQSAARTAAWALLLMLFGGRLVSAAPAASAASAVSAVSAAAATSASAAVPAPPAAAADRFGVYSWGIDDSAWPGSPGSPDKLNWGAAFVAAAGSRTVRVYLGPTNVYGVNPAVNPADDLYLQRIVAEPGSAYDTLFANPAFHTYLLTVFTPGDAADWWRGGFSAADAASEEAQLAALGEYLLANPRYAGKTFILLNWEGDNAIGANLTPAAPSYPVEADWQGFTAWAQARAAGVRDARAAVPATTVRLYSGLEFNLVDSPDGQRCGAAGLHCVIDRVAPRVDVDFYSYSSWQTLAIKQIDPTASLRAALADDLGFALDTVRAHRREVRAANFLLGEAGFARSAYGECAAAADLRELVQSFAEPGAFQVAYTIFWQVLDNAWRTADGAKAALTQCGRVDPLLYGLYRGRDLHQTLLGSELSHLLQGGPLTLPARCPTLGPDSLTNPQQSYKPIFGPQSPVAIFGKNFSGRDDEVWILQALTAASHTLTQLSATAHQAGWHDTSHQINATLPAAIEQPGCALLWVTSNQIDSNSEILSIQPAATLPHQAPERPPN